MGERNRVFVRRRGESERVLSLAMTIVPTDLGGYWPTPTLARSPVSVPTILATPCIIPRPFTLQCTCHPTPLSQAPRPHVLALAPACWATLVLLSVSSRFGGCSTILIRLVSYQPTIIFPFPYIKDSEYVSYYDTFPSRLSLCVILFSIPLM